MSGMTKEPAKCLRLPSRHAITLLSESNQFDRSCHTWKTVILERKPANRELGLEQNSWCLYDFKLVSHLGISPYSLDGSVLQCTSMSRVYFLIQTYTHYICNVVLGWEILISALNNITWLIPLKGAVTPKASDPHWLKDSFSPTQMKETTKGRWQPNQNTCSLPPQCTDKVRQRFGPAGGKLKTTKERN